MSVGGVLLFAAWGTSVLARSRLGRSTRMASDGAPVSLARWWRGPYLRVLARSARLMTRENFHDPSA
jgi:hypothetical protein